MIKYNLNSTVCLFFYISFHGFSTTLQNDKKLKNNNKKKLQKLYYNTNNTMTTTITTMPWTNDYNTWILHIQTHILTHEHTLEHTHIHKNNEYIKQKYI